MTLEKITTLLNSQFFTALVTIVVGTIAIGLYIKQRRDYKSDAAQLILQEIRFAEQIIRQWKEARDYRLYAKLLPTNNWNKNIHLFVNELEDTELDLINRFYSRAAYIDVLITKISDFKNRPASEPVINLQQNQNVTLPIDRMSMTQNILTEESLKIEFIYNSPVGEKLKKLASRKAFLYFF